MPASAMSNRPEELTERLRAASTEAGAEALLKVLREVKNQIIGNKTKKLVYLHLGAVPRIVSVLTSALDSGGGSTATNLIVQSAAALGSFACGVDAGVRAVLDAGAVPHLTRLLSSPDAKVVDAGARSLRMIFQSKLAPKHDFLEENSLKFLLLLLNSENENVIDLAASIVTHSCKSSAEQKILCDAGVLQRLVSLLEGSTWQRDSSLDSIAVIIRNNSETVSKFVGIDNGKALSFIVELMKDRYPRTRLLACMCLIVIGKASSCYVQELEIKTKLMLILIELLEEPGHTGDEAPFALMSLLADKEDLHKQALSINVVEKLCKFLCQGHMDGTFSKKKGHLDGKRLQGILLVLAELCSKLEKCRDLFMSSKVLNVVADALKHDSTNVRVAACTCITSISRSVKNLFAGHLANDLIVIPLVELLHDSSDHVKVAALKAICNVVVDFKDRKTVFVQRECVKQLVQLSKSMDYTLRLNAVWGLRNLMFHSDKMGKEGVLCELTESMLAGLICDSEPRVQEQALALVRNLVDGCVDSVERIFVEDGMILNAVVRQVRLTSVPEVCIQGMFVLANVAAGNDFHKEAVMAYLFPLRKEEPSPSFIIRSLQSNDGLLRAAAVWCIVNLSYPDYPSSCARVSRLCDSGILSQLKNMLNDPCLDVKVL
uniref:Armadillo repeat-containing protein 8 n=1 Tax=Anthurium amnicola TaxID=1678845 RepID=A0A1D1YR12_9ARAE